MNALERVLTLAPTSIVYEFKLHGPQLHCQWFEHPRH